MVNLATRSARNGRNNYIPVWCGQIFDLNVNLSRIVDAATNLLNLIFTEALHRLDSTRDSIGHAHYQVSAASVPDANGVTCNLMTIL
jgi:hypothetical protein